MKKGWFTAEHRGGLKECIKTEGRITKEVAEKLIGSNIYKYYAYDTRIKAHRYFQLFVMKGQDPFKTMTEKYIYNEKGYRTSVKPKYYKDFIKSYEPVIKIKGWQSKLFTNLIKIWLKNNEYRWIDEKDIINKFRNMINSDLQKTYDQYWNYNEQIRNTRRMIKENKDYWKRALEEA